MTWFDMILREEDDPAAMAAAFPFAKAMIGCPHDPIYHMEGDPWVHTCKVVENLVSAQGFQDLPEDRRKALRFAAWLHDVAKPMTTVFEIDDLGRDRVRQPGHAPMGAKIAWGELLDAGCDADLARDIYALVFWHQRPAHLLKDKAAAKRMISFGHETVACCWDDLLRFCIADQDGRTHLDPADDAYDSIEMVRMMLEDEGRNASTDLTHDRWPFETAAARFRFLSSNNGASAFFTPQDPSGSRVIMMSGMQGSGKDTIISERFPHLPTVSMDDLRARMRVSPEEDQGQVVQAAMEEARVHLRAGQDFIWNGTCVSRLTRQKVISLAVAYDARIDAISIDIPESVAQARNAKRDNPVPSWVIAKTARKREPILPSEAFSVTSVDQDGNFRLVFGDPEQAPEPSP